MTLGRSAAMRLPLCTMPPPLPRLPLLFDLTLWGRVSPISSSPTFVSSNTGGVRALLAASAASTAHSTGSLHGRDVGTPHHVLSASTRLSPCTPSASLPTVSSTLWVQRPSALPLLLLPPPRFALKLRASLRAFDVMVLWSSVVHGGLASSSVTLVSCGVGMARLLACTACVVRMARLCVTRPVV